MIVKITPQNATTFDQAQLKIGFSQIQSRPVKLLIGVLLWAIYDFDL